MGVLSLGNTIPEHDDLVGEISSLGLEEGVVRFGHGSEIGNDLPDIVSYGPWGTFKLLTFDLPGVGYRERPWSVHR